MSCACAAGFNSTGAWSSVNHFHLQGFFLNELSAQPLPVLTQRRRELFQYCGADAPVAAFELPDWPMHCYAIGARDRSSASRAVVRSIVHVAWTLVELLQAQNVPHNVLLAHDIETSQPLVIVFPRKLQQENGVTLFPELSGGVGLHFAIAEVAGLVVASSAGVFERFTQDAFVQILSDEVSLTKVRLRYCLVLWLVVCAGRVQGQCLAWPPHDCCCCCCCGQERELCGWQLTALLVARIALCAGHGAASCDRLAPRVL